MEIKNFLWETDNEKSHLSTDRCDFDFIKIELAYDSCVHILHSADQAENRKNETDQGKPCKAADDNADDLQYNCQDSKENADKSFVNLVAVCNEDNSCNQVNNGKDCADNQHCGNSGIADAIGGESAHYRAACCENNQTDAGKDDEKNATYL